jgi:hypothetical protein
MLTFARQAAKEMPPKPYSWVKLAKGTLTNVQPVDVVKVFP